MIQPRHVHLVGATGVIRTAVYNGMEHLVVPVVGMVEGVVWAVNAEYPEFVPAEELAKTPQQWNGRAVFANHPEDGGSQITANTPDVLEQSFGTVFNTASETKILATKRLTFDAYIDPMKATKVGPEAVDIVRRLKAGETVEVSVGCYVVSEDGEGVHGDKVYVGTWRDIVSDHLAFLPTGHKGACSVEAGCGAPRMAVRHLVTAEGIRREDAMPAKISPEPQKAEVPKRSLRERFMGLLTRWSEGVSDTDLRYSLDVALKAIEPGYMGIDSVFPDEGKVIYYVAPTDEWKLKRRSYTLTDGGVATLTEDAEEVEPVTTYETVKAASAAVAPCPCGHKAAAAEQPAKEFIMKDTVKTLIEGSNGKYTVWLDAVPDDRLAVLAEKSAPVVVPPATVVVPVEPPKTAEVSEEEFLASAPQSIRDIVARQRAADAAERGVIITALKAAASGIYTDAELAEKPVEELKKLAAVAKADVQVDFSGRGVARTPEKGDDYTPPNAYDAELKAMRGTTVN